MVGLVVIVLNRRDHGLHGAQKEQRLHVVATEACLSNRNDPITLFSIYDATKMAFRGHSPWSCFGHAIASLTLETTR